MPGQVALTTADPKQIGEYQLIGRLAEGGQGVVYLAQTPSGQRVAVKLLRGAWSADPAARARLVKEVAAARQVARFCTAQVIEARVDGDTPFIVSEYVDGPSLADFVQTRGPLAGADLDRLAVSTATALVAIHQAQIVHRDLKPANVMLGPDGPRVIDFGIARDLFTEVTVTDHIFGTPSFMAPEQVAGGALGPAADLFAWACTIVFAATGRSAFAATNVTEVMHQILYEEPVLTGVPAPLAAILIHCLDKDPTRRPTAQQTLLQLLGDLGPTRDAAELGDTLAQASQLVGRPAAPRPTSAPSDATDRFQPVTDDYLPTDQQTDQARGRGGRSRSLSGGLLVIFTVLAVAAVLAVIVIIRFTNMPLSLQAGAGAANTPAARTSPAVAAVTPSATPTLVIPAAFGGTWMGTLNQPNAGAFPVTLTLITGAQTGTYALPSLGCEAALTVIQPPPTGQQLHLSEMITADPNQACAQAASITLSPDGLGHLNLSWQDDARPNNTATAVLNKV